MVRKYLQALVAIVLACGMLSCEKDPVSLPTVPAEGRRVYIVCEGSLGQGNAALSVYLPEKDSVYIDAYQAANGSALGDVAQSALIRGNKLYVCVNNSDKILVLNKSTFKLEHTIQVRKPRYIVPISDSAAVVSTLFSNTLYRVSLQSNTITDSIKIGRQNSEGMLVQNGLLYVCPWDVSATRLYVIENGKTVIDSIPVGGAPHSILLDKNQHAWVLSGNVPKGIGAKLTKLDLPARTPLSSFTFPANANPIRPYFNPTSDTLYFIGVNYNGGTANNGIFRMGIGDAALPSQPFIAAQALQYFWALGIDPQTGRIYVGDPKGFTQRGRLLQYNQQGQFLQEDTVGVGPGSMYFE